MKTKKEIIRAIFGLDEIPEYMHELWEPHIELHWLTEQQETELVELGEDGRDVQKAFRGARRALLELQKAVQKVGEDRRVIE
tara:strand:+ start:313 stop:558 length:246 start_codon:yes stop_codon:yes gene_type:complete